MFYCYFVIIEKLHYLKINLCFINLLQTAEISVSEKGTRQENNKNEHLGASSSTGDVRSLPNPLPVSVFKEVSEGILFSDQRLGMPSVPKLERNPKDRVTASILATGLDKTPEDWSRKLREGKADEQPGSFYFNIDKNYDAILKIQQDCLRKLGIIPGTEKNEREKSTGAASAQDKFEELSDTGFTLPQINVKRTVVVTEKPKDVSLEKEKSTGAASVQDNAASYQPMDVDEDVLLILADGSIDDLLPM